MIKVGKVYSSLCAWAKRLKFVYLGQPRCLGAEYLGCCPSMKDENDKLIERDFFFPFPFGFNQSCDNFCISSIASVGRGIL